MNSVTKVYSDSGANGDLFKGRESIECFHFPYDPNNRGKHLKQKLAYPTNLTWQDGNLTWLEIGDYTWEDSEESEAYDGIKKIVGYNKQRDIFHLCSAYETGCHIFVTSDKGDIFNNRFQIESVTGIKVFYFNSNNYKENIDEYIKSLYRAMNLCE